MIKCCNNIFCDTNNNNDVEWQWPSNAPEQWWGGDTCRDRQHPAPLVDGRDNGPLCLQYHTQLCGFSPTIAPNFPRDDCKLLNQLRYLRFIPGPTRGDSSLACISRTFSSEIWKLGTAVLQQQPSFLQKPVIQPQLGLLCTPQEGLLGAYEEETEKQSEVIPPRLFACSLSQIHVAIILQRQVVARAIPTQWEEAGTMNAIVTKNTREHETPEMFDRLIHDACC